MNTLTQNQAQQILLSAIEALQQGECLLAEVSEETYNQKVPAAFNASIGGHYRHCLDHFRAVLESAGSQKLNYDHRERGTIVETDPSAALEATRELMEGFQGMNPVLLGRALVVTCKTSYQSVESQTATSTLSRELMYSVAHAVHHYALIGVMASLLGLPLPPGFGVAPSTLKHQAAMSPARA